MTEGRVVKALSGFFYVQIGEEIYTCTSSGKLKYGNTVPLVGDRVGISVSPGRTGSVESILPRKNSLIRPAVANIDCMIFLASNVNPVTDPLLIDRMSVIAEYINCEFVLIINKIDLTEADTFGKIYEDIGYKVFRTSATQNTGIKETDSYLRGKTSVLTGNSGVGKSSILNAINPELSLKTGEVSEKLGRGKHTTRHVEMFEIAPDTFIIDTPGFASFDISMISAIKSSELQGCMKEFSPFIGTCRYSDCNHISEPGCSVRKAVKEGSISESRYASYRKLFEFLKDSEARQY